MSKLRGVSLEHGRACKNDARTRWHREKRLMTSTDDTASHNLPSELPFRVVLSRAIPPIPFLFCPVPSELCFIIQEPQLSFRCNRALLKVRWQYPDIYTRETVATLRHPVNPSHRSQHFREQVDMKNGIRFQRIIGQTPNLFYPQTPSLKPKPWKFASLSPAQS